MKKIRVISIITTICIMALIFFFSSQTREESSEVSRGVVKKIVDAITKITSGSESNKKHLADLMHDFVRSMAHFAVFALLGASSAVMFRTHLDKPKKTVVITTLVFCFIYACSDEIHQIFVSGRAFQFTDIVVDSIGSAGGIAIAVLFENIFRVKKEGDIT